MVAMDMKRLLHDISILLLKNGCVKNPLDPIALA